MSWYRLGDITFWVASGAMILFALLYLVFAPWWKSRAGRNIMAVMGSMAVTFAYFDWVIAIKRIPQGFMPTRALLFFAIALAAGWRTVIFIRFHIIPSLRTGRERKNEMVNARQDDR